MPIKHAFTSPITDDNDPDIVGPDDWNDDHEGFNFVNTDADPGTTIYVGFTDPATLYTLQEGDVWIERDA